MLIVFILLLCHTGATDTGDNKGYLTWLDLTWLSNVADLRYFSFQNNTRAAMQINDVYLNGNPLSELSKESKMKSSLVAINININTE